MMRNKEVTPMKTKSTIAKLLAEEDIHVVYKQMDTAYFNPKSRELGLPIWDEDKTTADIEDLMVCHEIAHALWTPLDMLEKAQVRKINFSFVNIVEDARIERKVQDKYPGSVAVFSRGYRDLTVLDFFGIGDKDVSKLNLIDRINLFFKKQDVTFSDVEKVWVDRVANTKTPEDVLDLAEELYKWMEENESETDNHNNGEEGESMDSGEEGEGSASGEKSEGNENGNSDNKSSDNESESDNGASSGGSSSASEGEVDEENDNDNGSGSDTKSDDASDMDVDNKSDDLKSSDPEGGVGKPSAGGAPMATTDTGSGIDSLRDKNAKDRVYGKIPDTSKFDLIVSYKKLMEDFKLQVVSGIRYDSSCNRFKTNTLKELETIKKESKKTVSYMVKEFEMKKSADAYARANVSKTGSLDMGKLHTYKYNDDIFRKVTTMPGATNHGMVMVLDWSGSMADNLRGTISQLFNLIWFCRQTRIPFEVYAFSDQYNSSSRYETNYTNFKSGNIILRDMKLLNLFSSNMNVKEEMEMMLNCLMVSYQWGYPNWRENGNPIRFSSKLNLGGTPLNEAIVAMMDIVPKFKSDTGVQKVNTIFLTDGASTSLSGIYNYRLNKDTGEHSESSIECQTYRNDLIFMITDPKTNKTYEAPQGRTGITNTLLKILKDRIADMNVVGFFIAGKGKSGKVDKRTLMNLLREDSYEEIMEKVKFINKEKYLAISQAGYDEYYILPGGNTLMTENDGLSEELVGASKAKLKAAFGKSMASKITSRQLLNKFVKLVA
jgi:hypothetical protein